MTPVGVAGEGQDDPNVQLSLGSDVAPTSVEEVSVVGSVSDVAGTTTADGSVDVRTTSTTLEEGGDATESSPTRAYTGERVAIFANELDEGLSIETTDGDFVFSGSTGEGSHIYVFTTRERNGSATYEFAFGGASAGSQYLTLRPLGLEISVDDVSVTTGETIEGVVTANAGNRMIDLELGDDEATTEVTLNGSGGAEFSFAAPEKTGNYTITATDVATDTSVESQEVEVTEEPDEGISFTDSVYEEDRGDLVNVTVNTTNTEQASVVVGSFEAGYIANLTLTDGDDDGQVRFQMNSFNASTAGADAYRVVRDNDDDTDSLAVNYTASAYDDLLPATALNLQAAPGADNYDESAVDAVATISLRERRAASFNLTNWRAPRSTDYQDISTVGDITAEVQDGALTRTDTIAQEDLLVMEVVAPGVTGIIAAQNGANTTERFLNTFGATSPDLADLNVMGPDDRELRLSPSSTQVVINSSSDTHYVIVDTAAPVYVDDNENDQRDPGEETDFRGRTFEFEAGTTYTSNATFYESDVTGFDSQATVTDAVTVEERDAAIVVEGDALRLPASTNATLNATTTIAPGSELSMRVQSNDLTVPFFESEPATPVRLVGGEEIASATFDLLNVSAGTNFTATVSGSALPDDVTEDG